MRSATTSKGMKQGLQGDLWWCVFVTDNDNRLSLGNGEANQPKTISDGADISFVRVQKIHGPILSLSSVIAEGAGYLEFERPMSFDQEIRRALYADLGFCTESVDSAAGRPREQVAAPIRTNAGLEGFEDTLEESIATRASATSLTTRLSSTELDGDPNANRQIFFACFSPPPLRIRERRGST